MYKKSFFVALLSIIVVGLVMTATGTITSFVALSSPLPSTFDPKITLQQATKVSKKPILLEFYTDSCGTCRRVAPIVHKVKEQMKDQVTFVMVDVNDARQQFAVEAFNIEVIPALFVFDPVKKKKIQIKPDFLFDSETLHQGIDNSLNTIGRCGSASKNC